jgi:predicted PurR-regulated permease PerM
MRLGTDRRLVLLALTALALWLGWKLVQPFAGVLFMAVVGAVAFSPLQDWLTARLRGRPSAAAGLLVVALLLGLAGPVGAVAAVLAQQAATGLEWLPAALDPQAAADLVARLPVVLQEPARDALAQLPHGAAELRRLLASELGGKAASTLGGFLRATGTAVVHFLLFLVALFFLLVDGRRLVRWLQDTLPLPGGKAAALFASLRSVTLAVLVSTLATAGIQAVLALAGYFLAGVPSPLFFAAVTFFTALVPAVGTALVWVPLAVLSLATGHPVAGAFLAAWGIGVVGMVDNFVKPILIRRGVSFPTGVVFFALIGGLAAFGPVGLLAGPLVVAFLTAVVQAQKEW